nr:hypothetical protein [Anaerolineales bacterium]
ESFLLILFNFFWVVGAGIGILVLAYGAIIPFLPYVLLGLLLLIPWPIVTLGLFYAVYEIGQGRAIGLRTFFAGGWRVRKHAYRWGLLNLFVMIILGSNIRFYSSPETPLGGTNIGAVLSSFFLSLTVLWLVWQLYTLSMFPRMKEPRLLLTMRQAGLLVLRQPIPSFFVAILAVLLGLASFFLPILPLLLTFSVIAVLANRATAEILGEGDDEQTT